MKITAQNRVTIPKGIMSCLPDGYRPIIGNTAFLFASGEPALLKLAVNDEEFRHKQLIHSWLLNAEQVSIIDNGNGTPSICLSKFRSLFGTEAYLEYDLPNNEIKINSKS